MSPADYRMIPVADLLPHPNNPRTDLGHPQKLAELANDIAENGNTIRLRVVPVTEGPDAGKFLLVEGHRRTEAAKLGGVPELLSWVDPSLDTLAKQIEAMLRENTHREGITASNEAKAIQTMLDCEGMSVKKVAKSIHRSETFIRSRSRFAARPEIAHKLVDTGGLTLEQSEAFDEFEDDHEAYQQLILMATNPHRGRGDWENVVNRLRTKRDAPARKAAAEALIKELKVPTITNQQSYSYDRDYRADERTDAEHAAAGELALVDSYSGKIQWYRKQTRETSKKIPLTEAQVAEKKRLKDLEAGLEQDQAIWDEHLRRSLTDAGGGLPLTAEEKRIRAGLAASVLRHNGDHVRASQLLLNREYSYSSGDGEALRGAIAKLRPLQLTMLIAELHLRPDSLHKPGNWDPSSYGWREHEGVARWILIRQDIFDYPPSVFELETMEHFRASAAERKAQRDAEAAETEAFAAEESENDDA